MESLIWTPHLYGGRSLEIHLDQNFARSMISSQAPPGNQKRLNDLATGDLKRFGLHHLDPYSFHEDSCFVKQIYLGSNGVWLATSKFEIDKLLRGTSLEKPIKYEPHNVDHAINCYLLMSLFDRWVEYSKFLKQPA